MPDRVVGDAPLSRRSEAWLRARRSDLDHTASLAMRGWVATAASVEAAEARALVDAELERRGVPLKVPGKAGRKPKVAT